MKQGEDTSAVIDGLLRVLVGGGAIATILVAPGMAKVLDKPLFAYFNKLDKRSRKRETQRILYYMKRRGLVLSTTEDYLHGLVITKKGLKRLQNREFETLAIARPKNWDKRWRMVLFDIPEEHKVGRKQLIYKLKMIGFIQLQRSVWMHPFPCRSEIELVTKTYNVQKYVSYVEATGIDSEQHLIERFKDIL